MKEYRIGKRELLKILPRKEEKPDRSFWWEVLAIVLLVGVWLLVWVIL